MGGGKKDSRKKQNLKTKASSESKKEVVSYESKAMTSEVKAKQRNMIAVAHVYSSKNDTIITLTDISGAETVAVGSGGMMVSADSQEGSAYAAMQAAYKVAAIAKERGIKFINLKIRAPGGHNQKTPGPGAQAVLRVLARSGLKINKIEDVTPIPTDTTKRGGGRRGRRV